MISITPELYRYMQNRIKDADYINIIGDYGRPTQWTYPQSNKQSALALLQIQYEQGASAMVYSTFMTLQNETQTYLIQLTDGEDE